MNALSDPWPPEPEIRGVTLSVVIPVYNERPVLPLLYERLRTVLAPLQIRYELVLVDDGSRDGSGDYLVGLATEVPFIKAIRLSRNFGKQAALTAGLAQASGCGAKHQQWRHHSIAYPAITDQHLVGAANNNNNNN